MNPPAMHEDNRSPSPDHRRRRRQSRIFGAKNRTASSGPLKNCGRYLSRGFPSFQINFFSLIIQLISGSFSLVFDASFGEFNLTFSAAEGPPPPPPLPQSAGDSVSVPRLQSVVVGSVV